MRSLSVGEGYYNTSRIPLHQGFSILPPFIGVEVGIGIGIENDSPAYRKEEKGTAADTDSGSDPDSVIFRPFSKH